MPAHTIKTRRVCVLIVLVTSIRGLMHFNLYNQKIVNNILHFKGKLKSILMIVVEQERKHQLIRELWILLQLNVLEGTGLAWTLDKRLPRSDCPQVAAADSSSAFDGDLILISKHRRGKQNSPQTQSERMGRVIGVFNRRSYRLVLRPLVRKQPRCRPH